MKKNILLIICLGFFNIITAQTSEGSSIIFDYYPEKKIALPIVIYKNGEYLEPPQELYFDEYSGMSNSEKNNLIRLLDDFKKELSNCKKLFSLHNGVKNKSINVAKVSKYEGINAVWPALEVYKNETIPEHDLLSNNPKLGTKILHSLDKKDKPIIKTKRKEWMMDNGKYIEIYFSLISKIDIDGDGITEFIYGVQADESGWIEIYSKKNGKWKKVYEGSGDGA